MKISSFFAVIIYFTFLLFILPGCNKLVDYVKKHRGTNPPCVIQQFSWQDIFGDDAMTFTYNAAGNPIKGIRTHPTTGGPNLFFRYDQANRLTEFITGYGTAIPVDGEPVENWHKYFYRNGNIVLDSVYNVVEVVNGQPNTDIIGVKWTTSYFYDAQNRIVRDSTTPGIYLTPERTFSYDIQGNLVGATYDNKVNPRVTNKIWMFLDEDYSLNNPLSEGTTYTYNGSDLPASVEGISSFGRFAGWTGSPVVFVYNCH